MCRPDVVVRWSVECCCSSVFVCVECCGSVFVCVECCCGGNIRVSGGNDSVVFEESVPPRDVAVYAVFRTIAGSRLSSMEHGRDRNSLVDGCGDDCSLVELLLFRLLLSDGSWSSDAKNVGFNRSTEIFVFFPEMDISKYFSLLLIIGKGPL